MKNMKRSIQESIDNLLQENDKSNNFIMKYENNIIHKEEFVEIINSIINFLKKAGIKENSVVAVMENHNAFTFQMTIALCQLSCSIMYIDLSAGRESIDSLIAYYKPDFCFYNIDVYDFSGNVGEILPIRGNKYACGKTDYHDSHERTCKDVLQQIKISHTSPNFIFFTSGSTDVSKAVIRTTENLIQDAYNNILTFHIKESDTVLCAAAFGHVYGFGSGVMPYYLMGCKVIFTNPLNTWKNIIHIIQENKVTVFVGLAIHYKMILENWDGPLGLRLALTSGGILAPELNQKFFDKFHIILNNMYGTSETGAISTLYGQDTAVNLNSSGLPMAGVKVRCDGNEKNASIIYVNSAAIAPGYIDMKRHTIEPIKDREGWFKSNDLGYMDDMGYVHVCGRNDFIINCAGLKVNLIEIEAVMKDYDPELEVAVVAKQDFERGEIPVALIVWREGMDILGMKEYVEKKISRNCVPREFFIVDAIPKTPSGKIIRRKIRNEDERK